MIAETAIDIVTDELEIELLPSTNVGTNVGNSIDAGRDAGGAHVHSTRASAQTDPWLKTLLSPGRPATIWPTTFQRPTMGADVTGPARSSRAARKPIAKKRLRVVSLIVLIVLVVLMESWCWWCWWCWRSGGVVEWRSGGVAEWRSSGVAEWRSGSLVEWGGGNPPEGCVCA